MRSVSRVSTDRPKGVRGFFAYLAARKALLALWLCSVCIVLLLGALARQDALYIRYTAWLISFFALVCLLADYLPYRRRRRALALLKARSALIPDSLPEPLDALTTDYDELVRTLKRENATIGDDYRRALDEQKTYYTLWAHQIKTPIAATRLLLGSMEGDEVLLMRQEQHKIEQYVDLALKYAKLERIANELTIERCDLSEIVKSAVRHNALLFTGSGLTLTVDVPPQDVSTDPFWLSFIVEQLLTNAVKYTRRGGVRIYCENGELVVADTGAGIRKEDLPRLFERGYTGYNGRMDNRASGIGLFLVKRTANALHLCVRVESVFGEGTKVFLRLPQDDDFAAHS